MTIKKPNVNLLLQVPLPTVPQEQRFVVRQLEMPGFYRVLCRTGYTDTLVRDPAFLDSLLQVIVEEARYKALAAKCAPLPLPLLY